MLKQLEVTGFKSFAKKSVLEFKSPITAIVGPNGSGKSNIAESFRFCLGEQSIKSMRGKRTEDVIWNGSQELARANRASVRATFDNSKRIFNVDFDEVTVERVVSRDGLSEYFINGSQVRLKDVLELLAVAHIGTSSHHIISQGEADKILSSSAKERKEMLQDALGLKVYEYKKRESERKLEKTKENIEKVESLRREIAPHLRFLKKQVEKASKAEEIRESLSSLAKIYLARETRFITEEKSKLATEKEPILAELKRLEEEMNKAVTEIESTKKADSRSEELMRIESEIRKERQERDALEREAGRIEGELRANSRAMEKEQERSKSEENKTVPLHEVRVLGSEIIQQITNAEKVDDLSLLRKLISVIREKIENFIDSKKDHIDQNFLDELKKENTELESQNKQIEIKIQEKNTKLENLETENWRQREEINKQAGSLAEAEKKMLIISKEESERRAELDRVKTREESLRAVENNFINDSRELINLLGQSLLGFEKEAVEEEANPRQMQDERRRDIERLKVRLEEFGAAGGADILNEYREVSERDAFLEKELSDLNTSSESLLKMIEELNDKLLNEFKNGIEKVNRAFNEFFTLMFGGGSANLEVVKTEKRKAKNSEEGTEEEYEQNDSEEEKQEEGVEISVSLPKKRTKGLEMLSGGERALTSIALLFAISQVNPPPFIILDETDAALDEANSKKYGDMIESLSKFSQLILITHNRETMSRAGVIYGVTMSGSGISRLLSIAFDDAVAVAK